MVMRWIIATVLIMASGLAAAADLIASVDRKEIGRSDAVTLQVRYSDMAGFSAPDWDILHRDWNVVNKEQSQQISFNNGKNSSFTEWTLTLVPRRTGEVLIPAMEFKGAKSDPIRIQVDDKATAAPSETDNFYFEVEVSSGTHYVQEQILYIERMYYTVNHDDANLSEFTVANARVQPLMEPKKYITVVDGKRTGVYERRYAIFPEQPGTLVIPGQRFSARVTDRYNRVRGSAETIVSKPIELDINPIPDSYPQSPWIPASRFVLEESFSTPPAEWQAGEPVTRTFTIRATGLSAGQVPPVPMADIPGVRYYPDQTQDSSEVTEQGIVTTVVQSVALVPTNQGELILPEVRLPWWNTLENRVEYATLPEHTINITAGTLPSSPAAAPDQPQQESATTTSAPETNSTPAFWQWLAIGSGVFNLILLIAVAYLFQNRNRQTDPSADRQEAAQEKKQKEDEHFYWRELKKAARDNDAQRIREHIVSWAAAASGRKMTSLAQAEVWLNDVRLSAALAELDATLYSQNTNSAFNGQGLISLIEKARKNAEGEQSERKDELPEFY